MVSKGIMQTLLVICYHENVVKEVQIAKEMIKENDTKSTNYSTLSEFAHTASPRTSA